MKIIIVKSIFSPNFDYLNINIASISSLFLYLSKIKTNISISLYLIGWLNKSTWINIIENLIKFNNHIPHIINIDIELWKINYGKYEIINSFKNIIQDNDFLFYMDHDIDVSPLNVDFNLFFINDGYFSFNQYGDCRHQFDIYSNVFYLNNIKIGTSNLIGSIASGSFVISKDVVFYLPVFTDYPLYGFDDIKIIDSIKNKYNYGVFLEFYVYHPFDTIDSDNKYKKYKINKIIENINNNHKYSVNQEIEDSINFWNNF